MTLDEIAQLAARLQHSSIDSVDLELAGCSLKLRWAPQPITPASSRTQTELSPTATQAATVIQSPRMGIFLASHPLDNPDGAAPATHAGQAVRAGDIVGYVQAEAILVVVRAPQDGTIDQVLVSPQDVVGYAQPLFSLT